MARINWSTKGMPLVSYGLDRGVLYPKNGHGIPWDGLISVENDESGSTRGYFVDGNKYATRANSSDYVATVSVYTYPPVLDENYTGFGFSYRTMLGDGDNYLIHLIYDAYFQFQGMAHTTSSDNPEPDLMKFKAHTKTVNHREMKPSAHIIINTERAKPEAIAELEGFLYGSDISEPVLPSIDDVYEIFEKHAILRITDHGDGTWTAEGPDEAIVMLSESIFEITWPSAIYIDEHTYTISSL